MLLQVLDDGRITDGQGRTVDFKNTVIIVTSNLGSQHILDVEDNPEQREARVMETLRGQLPAPLKESAREGKIVFTS